MRRDGTAWQFVATDAFEGETPRTRQGFCGSTQNWFNQGNLGLSNSITASVNHTQQPGAGAAAAKEPQTWLSPRWHRTCCCLPAGPPVCCSKATQPHCHSCNRRSQGAMLELGRGRSDTRQEEQQQISDQVSPSAAGERQQQFMCGMMLYVYYHDHNCVSAGLCSTTLSSNNSNPRVGVLACAQLELPFIPRQQTYRSHLPPPNWQQQHLKQPPNQPSVPPVRRQSALGAAQQPAWLQQAAAAAGARAAYSSYDINTRTKPHVNVGTIGHVDHGKTTLTAAITKVGGWVCGGPAGGVSSLWRWFVCLSLGGGRVCLWVGWMKCVFFGGEEERLQPLNLEQPGM